MAYIETVKSVRLFTLDFAKDMVHKYKNTLSHFIKYTAGKFAGWVGHKIVNTMRIETFFIAIGITFAVLLFVRVFWKPLALIALTLYILGHLAFWSFLSAVLWALFVNQTTEGWGLLWLYFFLTYAGIFIVYVLITADIISMVLEWFRSWIKWNKCFSYVWQWNICVDCLDKMKYLFQYCSNMKNAGHKKSISQVQDFGWVAQKQKWLHHYGVDQKSKWRVGHFRGCW